MVERRFERIRPAISRLPRTDVEKVKEKVIYYGIRTTTPVIREWQENIARRTSVEFEENFWEEYFELRKEGYHPLNIGNHTAHQDADSMSLVTEKQLTAEKFLRKDVRLKGFQLPLAMSLANGDQGAALQAVYIADYPLIVRRGLVPLLLTRDKDVESYNAEKNLIKFYKELHGAIKSNWGIAVFPEGTTTGGKKNEKGEINGMQAFKEDSIRSLISATKRAGKKPMIIPVGVDGGYRVLNPDTKLPRRIALRIGLNLSTKSLVRVNVGLPLKADHGLLGRLVYEKDWEAVNELIGKEVATRIPRKLRGVYA